MFNNCSTVKAIISNSIFSVHHFKKHNCLCWPYQWYNLWHHRDDVFHSFFFIYCEKGSCYVIHSGCPRSHSLGQNGLTLFVVFSCAASWVQDSKYERMSHHTSWHSLSFFNQVHSFFFFFWCHCLQPYTVSLKVSCSAFLTVSTWRPITLTFRMDYFLQLGFQLKVYALLMTNSKINVFQEKIIITNIILQKFDKYHFPT